MSTDVHTLTGAYVLDAVSEVERRAFEHHMTGCPSCTQEVLELRETTIRLGAATVASPSSALWDRVCREARTTRQLSPSPGTFTPRAGKRRRWTRAAIAVAAATVLAAVTTGIALNDQSGELADQLATSHSRLDRVTAILGAPDAQVAKHSGADGRTVTMVMSRSANGTVLMAHGLPGLSPIHSFQAWFVTRDGKKTSAGVLNSSSGTLLAPSASANTSSLALTLEPLGGSVVPSDNVVLAVPIPASV
ncbi:MAG: anti-sigma factor [Kibdelosporangium sp.]